MNFPPEQDGWLTLQDAAATLGISTDELKKVMMAGEIRSKRCTDSRRAHFRISTIWLQEYERTTKSPIIWNRLFGWMITFCQVYVQTPTDA